MRGVTTWTVDGASTELGPGEAMHVPRGQVHGFENGHDDDATFLAIATPALFGPEYFTDLSAVLAAGGPPDMAAVHEVMHRHGLTPA